MRRFLKLLPAILLVALLGTRPAEAWGPFGHETVAEVAWLELGADADGLLIRERIGEILGNHPFRNQDLDWNSTSASQRAHRAFLRSSNWPDIIKGKKPKPNKPKKDPHPFYAQFPAHFGRGLGAPTYDQKWEFEHDLHAWHYRDVKLKTVAGQVKPIEDVPEVPVTTDASQAADALRALAWARGVLSGAITTQDNDAMRAIALCWVVHLVGDLHQPLHCATLTDNAADGDNGGGLFFLPQQSGSASLHSLWDGILNDLGSSPSALAEELRGLDPTDRIGPLETGGELELDARHWVLQGAAYAASDAYGLDGTPLRARIITAQGQGGNALETLFDEYRTNGSELAKKRALLGGRRLAAILKQDLRIVAPEPVPPTPPTPPAPVPGAIHPELSGVALVRALREENSPTHVGTYSEARQQMFATIDNFSGKVACVYTGVTVTTSGIPNPTIMNAEHTWPQSRFEDAAVRGAIKADLHHLYPTLSPVNSSRGNDPFADIDDAITEVWWHKATAELVRPAAATIATYSESTGTLFEPREEHKGNAARALFYVATIYSDQNLNLTWFRPQIETLVLWNQQDPPDPAEMARNDKVKQFQGNRNPFVLDATLVGRVAEALR